MLLLIDNYDSFTYNLYQSILCHEQSLEVLVVRNDNLSREELYSLSPAAVVISPGPGTPRDTGICREALELFIGKVPILGVCLGYQLIAEMFGATLQRSAKPQHGKTSLICHCGLRLFEGVRAKCYVARYHSLEVQSKTLPQDFQVDAAIESTGELMAISHKEQELFGVQFHPESFLTEDGDCMIGNFLKRVAV